MLSTVLSPFNMTSLDIELTEYSSTTYEMAQSDPLALHTLRFISEEGLLSLLSKLSIRITAETVR